MDKILQTGTIWNKIAKAVSLLFAAGLMTYMVYCAHRDAGKTDKKTYMPASKAANPTPFEPTPGELVTEKVTGKKKDPKAKKKQPGEKEIEIKKTEEKTGKKKVKKKPVFIHTSKSGVFRLPIKKKETKITEQKSENRN